MSNLLNTAALPLALGLPPVPPWEGLHPLVVHFPIAIVFAVPVLLAMSMLYRRGKHGLVVAAVALSVASVVSMWVASATGEAAFDRAVAVDGAQEILSRHEHLAEFARNYFTVLTAILVVIVSVCWWKFPHPNARLKMASTVVYIALHLVGIVILSDAAHEGGRLVHEVGVRALMAAPKS